MNLKAFYRPQKKLLGGNVFTCVCLFTGGWYPWSHVLSRVWVSLVSGAAGYCPGCEYSPLPRHMDCRDTVKQAVHILLECFLVVFMFVAVVATQEDVYLDLSKNK